MHCHKVKLNFHVVNSLNTFVNMLRLKLCKGSWAPCILYPEGGSSRSVMGMSDADVLDELQYMIRAPLEDSQDRESVEEEFPKIARAVFDPYQS